MIFSPSWKLRMLKQTLPVHSLQPSSHVEGEIIFPRKTWKRSFKSKTLDRTTWWKILQIVPSRRPQGLYGDSLQATRPCKVQDCSRWSRKDVEDLRVMILNMQVDPEEYPDSASGQYQDQVWLIDPEHLYSTLI